MLPNDVGRLARIPDQIVKLRLGRAHVFPLIGADAAKLGPSHIHFGVERLSVGNSGRYRPARKCRDQAGALRLVRRFPAHQLEQGRQKVDASHLWFDSHASGDPRTRHHEDDPQGRVVQKNSVRELAVFAQALAVIGEKRNDGVLRGLRPNDVNQAAKLSIRVGDFAVIEMVLVPLPKRAGRIVRKMRIV